MADGLEVLDQLDIDGRHSHEHAVGVLLHLGRYPRDVEFGKQMDGGARPQSATEDVDDAVKMVQRQEQGNRVLIGPGPGIDERGDLGTDSLVGAHHPLGLVGGATGEHHHGAPLRVHRRQRAGGVRQHIFCGQQRHIQRFAKRAQCIVVFDAGDQPGDAGTAQVVFEFRHRRGDIQRHGNAAGSPCAVHHGHIVQAGGQEEGHALLVEILPALQQSAGAAVNPRIDLGVGVLRIALDQGNPVIGIVQMGKGSVGHGVDHSRGTPIKRDFGVQCKGGHKGGSRPTRIPCLVGKRPHPCGAWLRSPQSGTPPHIYLQEQCQLQQCRIYWPVLIVGNPKIPFGRVR